MTCLYSTCQAALGTLQFYSCGRRQNGKRREANSCSASLALVLRVQRKARHFTVDGLRGLAFCLGLDRLLAANVDLDLLGLGFGMLGQLELQYAIV